MAEDDTPQWYGPGYDSLHEQGWKPLSWERDDKESWEKQSLECGE
jgi:hypothetical protein